MRTKIRLARFGTKKRPFYRVVVASVTSPRNGRFIEVVGHYDPALGIGKAHLEKEKVSLWLKRGAQPTEIVRQLMKQSQA